MTNEEALAKERQRVAELQVENLLLKNALAIAQNENEAIIKACVTKEQADKINGMLTELKEGIARLKSDKKRIDWLEARKPLTWTHWLIAKLPVPNQVRFANTINREISFAGETLREAIDAAIKGEAK